MNGKPVGFLFLLGSITSEAFSHVAWKRAADAAPAGGGAARFLLAAARQYKIIGLGVALFAVQAAAWTLAIRYLKDLSLAYPASSLEYIVVVLLARVMLKEKVAARRWIGAALIVAGTALVLVQ